VVVSSERYNRERPDLILMAITSQMRPTPIVGEIALAEWQAAGLLKPSVVKPLITTIEATLVIRQLGARAPDDQEALRQAIAAIVG
jgi:mRNA interferase MazF